MSAFAWLAFIVILVGGGAALLRLPAFWADRWTGRFRQPDAAPSWWVWGDALWRAFRRSYPVGAVGFFLLAPLLMAMELSSEDAQSIWPEFAALCWLVASVTLLAGVTLLNRPKWVVAPRHRNELGALAEWRSSLRRDRGSVSDRD